MYKRTTSWVLITAATAIACGSSAPRPEPATAPPSLPAVISSFGTHPFWFGRSEHSPFGPMPYGLVARAVDGMIVLRGDVPPGMGLPDGSYQQFTIAPDAAAGSHLDFETSLAGPLATGRMLEHERTADRTRYCLPSEAGGCHAMDVLFRREGVGVRFETRRGDAPHHAVVLQPTAP